MMRQKMGGSGFETEDTVCLSTYLKFRKEARHLCGNKSKRSMEIASKYVEYVKYF
jgi:hypothetical protein